MKRSKLIFVFLFIASASEARIPPAVFQSYHKIIGLILADKSEELSRLINYPLKRDNPLPNILTARQFVTYYPKIFDAELKTKLRFYNDSNVFEHNGEYGLVGGSFDGDIWIDENGKIAGINYTSKAEEKLKSNSTKKIQAKVYAAVSSWKTNILVGRSNNSLFRIDETKNGLRYVSWGKGHTMADKPDLILYKGVAEAQGTQGGWTWTFFNADWTYVIDDVELAENNSELGYFLELSFKGEIKSRIRLEVIK